MYKLRIPITQYHEINLSTHDLINLLEQEEKKLCGRWETIIEREGKYYYYFRGYGSHNSHERLGEEVDSETLENYTIIRNAIDYLYRRN